MRSTLVMSCEMIRWQEKKHTPATYWKQYNCNQKRKGISCYMLETVQLKPVKKKTNSCYVLETV